MTERIYLNRDWVFNNQEKVDIPHNVYDIPYNYVNEDDYQLISNYKKNIFIDKKYEDKNLFLVFEGVAHYSEVYINKKLVIKNNCGYNLFKVNIKDYVKLNDNNEIEVIVNSKEDLNIPPFGNVIDYLTYGGIYRDVYLDICNDIYVEDLFVKPKYENNKWGIDLSVTLNKESKYKVIISFLDKVVYENEFDKKDNYIEFNEPKLWDIDNPNLYQIEVLVDDDKYIDHFGLRTAIFKNDGFYLNGKKVKILGLNRHQSFAYVGYAMPKSMQELDAKILKEELCVNAVRTSHYMQGKDFINACDKLGLLVFTEAPGWQHIGNDEWKKQHAINVKNMVTEYKNHPSIILWGVRVNESVDSHDLYLECNKIAREIDPTRQTGGVRCYTHGEELEDVYTYNDFCDPKMERGLSLKENVCSKNIPYLVSEFNGHMHPTKMFDREDVRINQAYRLAKGMNEFYGDSNIRGFFAWCMNDYNTHKDFGSGDRICYHGVLDMFRNPKVASYLYSSQGKKDYFNLSSELNIGDYDASNIDKIYAFTNADKINLYRDGILIKTYDKENRIFTNIPNSPFLIDDFVGDLLEKNEGYTHKESEMMKAVLYRTLKYGNKMPFKYKMMYLKLMLFHHVNYQKGYELYGKYIGNWGSKEIVYKFEAIRDNRIIKTINLSKAREKRIICNPSSLVLNENHTYDVALVRIKAVDQNDNILSYYNEGFKAEASLGIDLIGGNIQTFRGGYTGIYVKSNGKSDKGLLTIETQFGKEEIEFKINL